MARLSVLGVAVVAVLPFLNAWPASGQQGPPLFVPHAAIRIVGDEEFTTSNGVTGGDGSANDPYVISGWLIAASTEGPSSLPTGIWIENTSAYATILGNMVTAPLIGMHVRNSTHVRIHNNDVVVSFIGILAEKSPFVQIEANSILGLSPGPPFATAGIVTSRSQRASVLHNHVDNVWMGISFQFFSDHGLAAENYVTNALTPISSLRGSDETVIEDNEVCCSHTGITVETNRTLIRGNQLRRLEDTGIDVWTWNVDPPRDVVIERNLVQEAENGVVALCQSCSVRFNDFLRNEAGGVFYGSLNVSKNNFLGHDSPLQSRGWGSMTFRDNNIVGAGNSSMWANESVDARYNWWGSREGPGETVGGGFGYEPWLAAPVEDAGRHG